MLRTCLCLGIVGGIIGCGSSIPSKPLPKTAPAVGMVTLGGAPLAFASVTFVPRSKANGIESVGVTDEQGHFALKQVRGQAGVPPGDYTVVINRFVKSDGTPVSLNQGEFPANLGAVESLPPQFSNYSESVLLAKVPDTGGEFKFDLPRR
ncbi:MAG: carboxypeptidase-like regulatory domain-containing protein [Planctomycetota bacterium]